MQNSFIDGSSLSPALITNDDTTNRQSFNEAQQNELRRLSAENRALKAQFELQQQEIDELKALVRQQLQSQDK